MEELGKAEKWIHNAGRKLLDPGQDLNASATEKFDGRLLSGDSLVLEFDSRNSSIRRLSLRIKAEKTEQALRSTVISACFDGKCTVWVPVGEFFGAGYLIVPHETWMNRVSDDGEMT